MSAIKNDYDIVIVGGGLTGSALAGILSALPLSIAVVEKTPLHSKNIPEGRAIALTATSQTLLNTAGLWAGMNASALPIKQVHVSEQGRFGMVRLTAEENDLNALGYVVELTDLLTKLQQQAQEKSNVTWLCPWEVNTLAIADEQATVTLAQNNTSQSLSANLVIAADGSRSFCRETLGISIDEHDYCEDAIVSNITLAKDHNHVAYERFCKNGLVAMLPLQSQQCKSVITVPRDQVDDYMQWSDEEYLHYVQHQFGSRLGDFQSCGARVRYPLKTFLVKEQTRAHFLLMGNAAHTLHPIAAQGFNLALADIAAVADVFATALQQGAEVGSMSVLQHYTAWCQPEHMRMLKSTSMLEWLFANTCPPLPQLRSKGLLFLDMLPFVKKRIGEWGVGKRGKLSRLALGLPLL